MNKLNLVDLENNKILNLQLPNHSIQQTSEGKLPYSPPRNMVEELLATIWANVLEVDRKISIDDNFFKIGGHSLLATQAISKIRQTFQVDLPLRTMFQCPTIARFAEKLELARQEKHGVSVSISPTEPSTRDVLGDAIIFSPSLSQQRLWLLDKLDPDTPTYNIPRFFYLSGELDLTVLEHSFREIINRHEILRTFFIEVNGKLVQAVASNLVFCLKTVSFEHLSEEDQQREVLHLADEESRHPFDLSKSPLLRVSVLKLSSKKHVLFIVMHHIISDGWSLGLFFSELETLYQSFSSNKPSPLSELPIQYADFSVWQKQWLKEGVLAKQLLYWQKQLEGKLSVLQLPTDYPRPPRQTFNGSRVFFTVEGDSTSALKTLSQQENATLFMTLLTAFKILLYRYSKQHNIIVGTPVANRSITEIEKLIGFFINLLVLRTDLSGNPTFRQLLGKVLETSLDAYSNQDVPFEKLVEELQSERDMSVSPLFQVLFILQNTSHRTVQLEGINVEPLKIDNKTAKYDLTLSIEEVDQLLIGELEYNTDLFNQNTIDRMVGHFQTLLRAIVRDPNQTINNISFLTDSEKNLLLRDWNNTFVDYAKDICVHHLFEEQVNKTPESKAVSFEEQSLSYKELDIRANKLAHYLIGLGVGPETLVAVCLHRSIDMLVGLLAILKAGGAYLPLDPAFPEERLAFIVEDAKAAFLLTQKELQTKLPNQNASVILIDQLQRVDEQPKYSPSNKVASANIAYCIYTSGSTGKPKGTQIVHSAVVNFLTSMKHQPGLSSSDVLLSVTTLSFDIAVLELFLPIIVGGCLIIVKSEDSSNGEKLLEKIEKHNVTVLQATPVTWRLLLGAKWKGNKRLKMLCGGEALAPQLAEQLLEKGGSLWNMFGPTETTVWSTVSLIEPNQPIFIGRPIANTYIYILDENFQPVAVGMVGELYIGGDGLARGYLNRPELTAERFVANPFSLEPGARMYKTGDLAKYLPDGNIEFLGRNDYQVKIRGFRIELGEIETILDQHPSVHQSVVMVRENELGNKLVVAYLVSNLSLDLPPIDESFEYFDYRTRALRVPVDTVCAVEHEDKTKTVLTVIAVSVGGIGLASVPPHWKKGDSISIRLTLPGTAEELCLYGNIVWNEHMRAGVKIQTTEAQKAILQESITYVVNEHNLSISHLRAFVKDKLPEYMVPAVFVLLDKMPLTPNGKVDRKALPNLEQVVGELKTEKFVAPRTSTEKEVARIWRELVTDKQVGVNDNFFEVGGNSLLVTQLILRLREAFQIDLQPRIIFEASTIAQIAETVDAICQGKERTNSKDVVGLEKEVVLDPSIEFNLELPIGQTDAPQCIFLTGSTGFLGAFLLYELLNKTKADVYCLVRANSLDEGKIRIEQTLESYSLWELGFSSRIVPVLGDLSQPNLGLSLEQFQTLATNIDLIYHNGALVNYSYPYNVVKMTNVFGTQEVIRLAGYKKIKPLHYISTIAPWYLFSKEQIKEIKEDEAFSYTEELEVQTGYLQSKWVAEKIVMIARSRGLPVSIYRPGRITGHSQTGIGNTDDYLYRLVKGCIQLGSVPDSNFVVEMIPIDYVCQAIVHLSQQSLGKVFHLINSNQLSWKELVQWMCSFGYDLEQLPYKEWEDSLVNSSMKTTENALYPLLPFLSKQLKRTVPKLDCSNTLNGLKATEISCPPVNNLLLDTYFKHFVDNELIAPPKILQHS